MLTNKLSKLQKEYLDMDTSNESLISLPLILTLNFLSIHTLNWIVNLLHLLAIKNSNVMFLIFYDGNLISMKIIGFLLNTFFNFIRVHILKAFNCEMFVLIEHL